MHSGDNELTELCSVYFYFRLEITNKQHIRDTLIIKYRLFIQFVEHKYTRQVSNICVNIVNSKLPSDRGQIYLFNKDRNSCVQNFCPGQIG